MSGIKIVPNVGPSSLCFTLDCFPLFLSAPWSEEIHSRQALIVRSTVGWKQVAMIKRANCHRRRAKLKVGNDNTCRGAVCWISKCIVSAGWLFDLVVFVH